VARAAGHGRLGLALILVASFMAVLDFSIVNVALSSIQRELGISAASVQWVVTAYAIAFGGLLIVSRVVQGGGAAMVAPAALSLITTGFPEGPRRTRALGLYGATASVGFVAGQVLGDVLVEFLSWRSVFLVNVPVGLTALLLAPRVLPESRLPRAGRHLDVVGAVLITLTVGSLVVAVSQAGITGLGAATAGFAVLTQLPAGGGYRPLLTAVMLVGFGTAGTAFGSMVTASAGAVRVFGCVRSSHVPGHPVRCSATGCIHPFACPGRGREAWGGSASEGQAGSITGAPAPPEYDGGAEWTATSRLAGRASGPVMLPWPVRPRAARRAVTGSGSARRASRRRPG
jgi:MFS family permease